MHPWWNWQTRMVQVHVPSRAWRFESSRVHQPPLEAQRRVEAATPESFMRTE